MKNILIAVDGSPHARKALAVAASLVKQHEASATILHVVSGKGVSKEILKGIEIEFSHEIDQRIKAMDFHVPLPDESQYARTMLSQNENLSRVVYGIAGENMLKLARVYMHENGVENFETVLVNGDPADSIVAFSKAHDVDTIIMGCRGSGKLKGLLLGSVSQSVIHDAQCSVIIVK